MIKKRICPPLLLAAMLSMTACTEVLEPNVDYGGNTYINDYSSLVKAVNDLQKSLEERFDALNSLLKAGMLDMKVAIDENTGAIEVLEASTKSGLDNINTSMFDSFSALSGNLKDLSAQLKLNGENIVFAMNENGELLRAKIDENGKLIEASLLANNQALVDCINNNSKTLQERFAALTAAVKAGFYDVAVSIDANTSAISLMDKNVNTNLDAINTSLINGFSAVSSSVSATGNKIVTAMDNNGNLLRLTIDKNGNLINATLETLGTKLDTIAKALTDHNASFDEKIDALNSLLTAGLAQVNVNLGKLDTDLQGIGTTLNLQKVELEKMNTNLDNVNTTLGEIKTGLGDLKTELNSGFTLIGSKLDTNGNNIVTAMNNQGKAIELAINNQGAAIKASIVDLNKNLDTNLGKLITAQGDLKVAINNLSAQEKANAESIVKKLDELLNDQDIYMVTNETTKEQEIYVTPSMWEDILKNKGTDGSTYAAIDNMISAIEVKTEYHQWCQKDGDVDHYNTHPTAVKVTSVGTATLQALNLKAYPAVTGSKTKMLYKLYKTPGVIEMTLRNDCNEYLGTSVAYMITDGFGKHGKVNKSTTEWHNAEIGTGIKAYPAYNGKINETDDHKALVRVDLVNKPKYDSGFCNGMTIDAD